MRTQLHDETRATRQRLSSFLRETDSRMTALIVHSSKAPIGIRDTNESSVFSTRAMPTNLMHRVLAIQELLRHILGVFRLNRNDFQDARRRSEATSTFAALARTCKLFHEVSLDYLWETLPNVLPIVLLLSDSVDRSDVGTQSRVITSALAWIVSFLFRLLFLEN